MSKKNKKVCFECGDKYTGVRLDQRFCKQQCRNRYNNRRYREAAKATKTIDAKLHKNYQILTQLKEGQYSTKKVLANGFDLNYYTETGRTKKGQTLFYLYNMGFCLLNNNQIIHIFNRKTTT